MLPCILSATASLFLGPLGLGGNILLTSRLSACCIYPRVACLATGKLVCFTFCQQTFNLFLGGCQQDFLL